MSENRHYPVIAVTGSSGLEPAASKEAFGHVF